MRIWSCLVGTALLITASGFSGAVWLVLRLEGEAPLWQVGLALCVLCVPCCALAGLLALLSAALDKELTPKAFACDMMPEDAVREMHLV
mmetsp:Transcript_13543/g.37240  ORF Transcript_13543/g.37240 Transcript_13543/m.37240 type:complete len:89 (+) Transcript_13543:69-335(+)